MTSLIIFGLGTLIIILIILLTYSVLINLENEKVITDFKIHIERLENKITFLETLIEPTAFELDEKICLGRNVDENCERIIEEKNFTDD